VIHVYFLNVHNRKFRIKNNVKCMFDNGTYARNECLKIKNVII
jgi:hypothetical protein